MTQSAANAHLDQRVDVLFCDREPIHTPGAIQPQGALLVARLDDFMVTHASENLAEFLGLRTRAALGRPLHYVLGEEVCLAIRAR